jgi:predicted ATPase
VLISGEPGIGKSRLTAALQEHLQAEVHAHIRYFCSPHSQDSPLHPVISCLERIAGFTGDDGPDRRLDKLAAMLASVGAAQSDISSIAEFMSLPGGTRYPPPELSPRRKRERILAALVRQLEGLARQQPLLITFEDLHWIDPSSRELLDQIAARISQLPVLLIATCRPEFEPPWTGLSQMTLVVLNRLSRNDGAAMVRQLSTDTAPLPQEVANEIVERADGVPLFVEELTRSVIEASVDQAPTSSRAIPSTLQASLMARIDRLGFATKQVAQVAAAIRREFSLELLTASGQLPASVIGDGLERLIDACLVFQLGASPHATYVFKHTLIQDIVYGTMLRQQRRELHGNIATALEQYFPDRVASEPELLGQHFAEAGVIDKSADYFLQAGQVAIQRSAMTEAVAHLRKGVNVLSGAPDDTTRRERELNLQVSLARALIATKGYAAPEPGEAYARVRQLCEQLNRPPVGTRPGRPICDSPCPRRVVRPDFGSPYRQSYEPVTFSTICRASSSLMLRPVRGCQTLRVRWIKLSLAAWNRFIEDLTAGLSPLRAPGLRSRTPTDDAGPA